MNDEDFFSDDATLDGLDEEVLCALEQPAAANRKTQIDNASHVENQSEQEQHGWNEPEGQLRADYRGVGSLQARNSTYMNHNPPQRQYHTYQKNHQGYMSYSQQRQIGTQSKSIPVHHIDTSHPAHEIRQAGFQQQQQTSHHFQQHEEPTLPAITTDNIPGNKVSDKASSDYGDFEGFEETAELWDTTGPAVIQPEKEAQEYPVVNGGAYMYYNDAGVENSADQQENQPENDVVMGNTPQQADVTEIQEYVNVEELKSAIARLQLEREQLAQQLEETQKSEIRKAGEVAIVRNNLQKAARDHERAVASLHSVQNEEREKRNAEIEAMKADIERMRTERAFLSKEVEEISKQNRGLRLNIKHKHTSVDSKKSPNVIMSGTIEVEASRDRVSTPRQKHKNYNLGDGFEDEELIPINSSRCRETRTPTKTGIKRKRSANGIPDFHPPSPHFVDTSVQEEVLSIANDRLVENLFSHDDRLEFFEALIALKYTLNQQRVFDELHIFSFPSSPGTSLSASLLNKLSSLRITAKRGNFSAEASRLFIKMWSQCIDEEVFDALTFLFEMFRFSILWNQGDHCPDILDEAAAIIQRTVDVNAIPVATKRPEGKKVGVPTTECLQLMEDIALACLRDEVYIRRFWALIRSDFPMMCLYYMQPMEIIRRMVNILCTSVLTDSFGTITSNVSSQRSNEHFLMETITRHLEFTPKQSANEPKYSRMQLLELRQDIVQLLGCVCSTDKGMLELAKNTKVLSRLLIRVGEEVDQIYEWRVGEEARVEFINSSVRLLHAILTTHRQEEHRQLATNYKNLLTMARLAFSRGRAQEEGIDEETSGCAWTLLDNMITPEEAGPIEAMFHTPDDDPAI